MKRLSKITQIASGDEVILQEAGIVPHEEKEETRRFSFSELLGNLKKNFTTHDDEEKGLEQAEKKPFPFRLINRKVMLVACCVLVIALAVFLNLKFSGDNTITPEGSGDLTADTGLTGGSDAASTNAAVDDDYFALAVINRQRIRDEALDLLETVTTDSSTDSESKEKAYLEMTRMAGEINSEVNIETLIKGKGFSDCLAVIDDGNANIIVESDTLTASEVAQIKEIVYLEAGIVPANVKIVEKEP